MATCKTMGLIALISLALGVTATPTAVMAGQSSGDISYPEKLAHVRSYIAKLQKGQPEAVKAFYELHHAAVKPGALDTKVKELIGLAIAVVVRCEPCIAAHTGGALKAGATEAEIMEALSVSIVMGGGPAIGYAAHAVEAMEQFKETGK
jgi:AhpD family alkylhydroperoxidase